MRSAGYERDLLVDVQTALEINISWPYWHPACSTTPWQLDGVLRSLQTDGYPREPILAPATEPWWWMLTRVSIPTSTVPR